MTDEDKNNGTYQLITPPNALKARVGAGLGIDKELAKRANTAVENLQNNFMEQISTAVVEIAAQMSLAENSDDEGEEYAEEVSRISDDLLNQSLAFGFPLVSDVCKSLCGYMEKLEPGTPPAGAIVSAHIDILRSVIGNAIDDDGGAIGKELVVSLSALVARVQG